MKKKLAVFGLFSIAAWKKLLMTMCAMTAANVLIYVAEDPMGGNVFTEGSKGWRIAVFIAAVFVFLVLSSLSRGSSKTLYTIRRLGIPVKEVCFLKWLSSTICVTILLMTELIGWYVIAVINASGANYIGGPQGVAVEMLESSLTGSFLPMGNLILWIRLICLIVMLGLTGAYIDAMKMITGTGKFSISALCTIFGCVMTTVSRGRDMIMVGIAVDLAVIALFVMSMYLGFRDLDKEKEETRREREDEADTVKLKGKKQENETERGRRS